MDNIKNYKLKDFLKQPIEKIEKYLQILQYIAPIETEREVFYLKLKHVELIKRTINSNDDKEVIKMVSKVQKISKKEILELGIIEFFGIVNSIKNQVEKIVEAEEKALQSEHTNAKFELVEGGKRLEKFGFYNVLDSLSDGDVLKWKKIENLSYDIVFTKLYLNRVKSDIQIDMNNIKSKI
ncbi:hypothetical protein [Cochleicola gelatinilyticus]|uniref:DH domain-containing protein n=1 Tax=Cochleicola gelatinilyticus TaxID=1763537 RepID=A0A167HN02_9FLAO|nr:hypothetical protein [Cochleicola gelatinilyticus]OAB78785.1 hypothetical protein ULVI_09390 [Cochleicola gelatinilyticus]